MKRKDWFFISLSELHSLANFSRFTLLSDTDDKKLCNTSLFLSFRPMNCSVFIFLNAGDDSFNPKTYEEKAMGARGLDFDVN